MKTTEMKLSQLLTYLLAIDEWGVVSPWVGSCCRVESGLERGSVMGEIMGQP